MGDIAEMILAGILCEVCGTYIVGDEPGYPRKCSDCKEEKEKTAQQAAK